MMHVPHPFPRTNTGLRRCPAPITSPYQFPVQCRRAVTPGSVYCATHQRLQETKRARPKHGYPKWPAPLEEGL